MPIVIDCHCSNLKENTIEQVICHPFVAFAADSSRQSLQVTIYDFVVRSLGFDYVHDFVIIVAVILLYSFQTHSDVLFLDHYPHGMVMSFVVVTVQFYVLVMAMSFFVVMAFVVLVMMNVMVKCVYWAVMVMVMILVMVNAF